MTLRQASCPSQGADRFCKFLAGSSLTHFQRGQQAVLNKKPLACYLCCIVDLNAQESPSRPSPERSIAPMPPAWRRFCTPRDTRISNTASLCLYRTVVDSLIDQEPH